MEPGSYLHCGTICTSFCWPNSGTHRRSLLNPTGASQHRYVREGTFFANLTAACAMLHHARGGCIGIEQPRNSKLEIQQAMQYLMTWLQKSASGLYRHSLDLGAFGAESQKPIWLYSDQEVENIEVRLSKAEAEALTASVEQPLMVQRLAHFRKTLALYIAIYTSFPNLRYLDQDGNLRCHGGPGLKASQAYPERSLGFHWQVLASLGMLVFCSSGLAKRFVPGGWRIAGACEAKGASSCTCFFCIMRCRQRPSLFHTLDQAAAQSGSHAGQC